MSGSEVGAATIAMLGGGRMGQAILRGLLAAGHPVERVVVAEPDPATAQQLTSEYKVSVVPARDAVRNADLVVVAVKPQHVVGVLQDVSGSLREGATVVSIAAGVTLETLSASLPDDQPVIRVMPNTPSLVGQGMSVMSPAPGCPQESIDQASKVLSAIGQVRSVPESQQDAVTAVSGSGPAYVFYVAEAMIEAGVQLGLPRPLAHDLAVQTLVGASAMLLGDTHPSVLRENVTSPGGTTAAALHELDASAVRAAFARAMAACARRSAELA